MTSKEIHQVAEAAHQLPNLYRAAIMKEKDISTTTFSRWIKAEKNTPIFLKSGISLTVQMVLEECRMWAFDPSLYTYLGNSEELHLKCALLMEVGLNTRKHIKNAAGFVQRS